MIEDTITKKRGRGRKPVPDDVKRKHGVTCRLTDAELAHVDRLRGNMTAGEWVRTAALGRPPRIVPELNRQAWLELSRAASNLNQLAKLGHFTDVNVTEQLKAFRAALIGADLEADDEG